MGVFAHPLIIIMPRLNACGLQSKLLITPLSERSHTIIILQVYIIMVQPKISDHYIYSGLIV